MKKQYLVNCFLILVVTLSPAGSGIKIPISDDPNPTEVFMPFIGYSPSLVLVHKQNWCSRAFTFIVRGDITNRSNQAIYDVILEVRAYDGEGQWLETQLDSPIMTATLTGQLNPFETWFSVDCGTAYSSEIEIKSWSTDSPQVYWPATLVYTSTVEDLGYGTWVTAEFRNDAGLPMHDVTGLAWSLHEDYNIDYPLHIADVLAPGETVTYTNFLEGIGGLSISTIEAAAQGVVGP